MRGEECTNGEGGTADGCQQVNGAIMVMNNTAEIACAGYHLCMKLNGGEVGLFNEQRTIPGPLNDISGCMQR